MNPDSKVSRKTRRLTHYQKSKGKKKRRPLNPHESEKDDTAVNSSAKKLQNSKEHEVPIEDNIGYVLLNFATVFSCISDYVKCKVCGNDVTFKQASTRGLGFKILISCASCDAKSVPSCSYINKAYEINTRFIFAMRLLGIGLKGAKKFCGIMDLASPLTQNAFDAVVRNIQTASQVVCDHILRASVQKEREMTTVTEVAGSEIPTGLTVSGDGTWHKRGYNSLFGVSSIIGYYTGKVLDIIVKSKACKICEQFRNKDDNEEYQDFLEEHAKDCTVNHEESSDKMEIDAIREIFHRSLEKYGVRYQFYIGDGDSKTFKGLMDNPPYPDIRYKSSDNLLERCVGGFTQDPNESFNNVIWQIAPKHLNVEAHIINIAANIAACTFNSGANSYLQIMDVLNIKVGRIANTYCEAENAKCIKTADLRMQQAMHEARILHRQNKITAEETASTVEDILYGPGIDD